MKLAEKEKQEEQKEQENTDTELVNKDNYLLSSFALGKNLSYKDILLEKKKLTSSKNQKK